jgi:hypothetical protein
MTLTQSVTRTISGTSILNEYNTYVTTPPNNNYVRINYQLMKQ